MNNGGNSNSDSYSPSECYASLTPEAKDLRIKLIPHMKDIILKGRKNINRSNYRSNSNKSNNFSCKTVKPPSFNGEPFTKANLCELVNELIVESNECEDNDVVAEDAIGNNGSTLLFNSITANNINHGDIRKLFSNPSKVNSTPSSIKKTAFKSKINTNGKTCR